MAGRTGRAAAALLGALVLTGCGGQEGVDVGSGAASPPAASLRAVAPPSPTLAGELPEPLPGPSGRARGGVRTLTGTVVAGVEEGCLLLSTPAGDHLLLGGDRTLLRPGARLTVTGRPDPSLLTTCQQGVPFTVTSARPS